jgi:hypothetical protein
MTSVANLKSELEYLRDRVRGVPFDENPGAYKDIESAKVRLNLARDPDHYEKKYAAWFADREKRRQARRAA